jgi:hypothetical protein
MQRLCKIQSSKTILVDHSDAIASFIKPRHRYSFYVLFYMYVCQRREIKAFVKRNMTFEGNISFFDLCLIDV